MIDLNSQQIRNRNLEGSHGTTVFEVAKFLAFVAVVVGLLLTSAFIRDQMLSLRYEIEELKTSNEQFRDVNKLLRVEYQSLATPAEIERVATELGLTTSNDSKVLILESKTPHIPVAEPVQMAQSQSPRRVLHE